MECKIRKIVSAGMCLVGLFIMVASDSLAAVPGSCLNDDEVELLTLIDQYRLDNNLPKVPWSKSLTQVAQWHVIDAVQNDHYLFDDPCNMHSWSSTQPALWSDVCYTPDHADASKMWKKPFEISGGAYRWSGYEIAAWGYQSVSDALAGWKDSTGHNNVILNRGIWSAHPFKAMGVGVETKSNNQSYYFVWFAEVPDPQGEVEACSDSSLFSDNFE